MTWRHWFVVSVLLFMNVFIFGCMILTALGRVRMGF
jgi:hypothetical protein